MTFTQNSFATAALLAAAGAACAQVTPGDFTPEAVEDYEGTPGGRAILTSIFGGEVPVVPGSVEHRSIDEGDWTDFRSPGGPIVPVSGSKFGVGFGFGDFTLDFTGLGGITGFQGWASAAGVGADTIEFYDMGGNLMDTFTDPDGFGPGDGTMEKFSFVSTAPIGEVRLDGVETAYDDLGFSTTGSGAQELGVRGPITGTLNGSRVDATMVGSGNTETGFVSIDAGPLAADLGDALAWCVIHISGVCASVAVESGGAMNMLTLTDGSFTRDLTIEFFDGKVMRATQSCLRQGDAFLFSSEVSGEIPLIPPGAPFQILDYSDLYAQLDSDTVRVSADRLYLADLDGDGVLDPEPYRVTATIDIHYDGARQLPFDQRLEGTGALTSFDPTTRSRHWEVTNFMTPAAPCRADLDGDGVLDIFDFLAFSNLFDQGDPRADFDGDGTLDIFDFLAFSNAFDAGC
ncbi:MAG: GC-type dockerin domain-anchored protein [Phycisphaerales bacterium JB060]